MSPREPICVPPGAVGADVGVVRAGRVESQSDWIADEMPVAIVVNGISHAVMLATPADLPDFALGFALTEGLVDGRADVHDIEVEPVADGIELRLEVSSACAWRLRERRRTLAGRTGCGICGAESLSTVRLPPRPVTARALRADAILRAHREMEGLQPLRRLTGATHAAAWCAPDGTVRLVREDVGRHNALDKVIGAAIRGGVDLQDGFLAISSRASFEMVQKSTRVGIAALSAVSAPTSMAVALAAECGQLLVGFVRQGGLVAYAGAQHLVAGRASAGPASEASPDASSNTSPNASPNA